MFIKKLTKNNLCVIVSSNYYDHFPIFKIIIEVPKYNFKLFQFPIQMILYLACNQFYIGLKKVILFMKSPTLM